MDILSVDLIHRFTLVPGLWDASAPPHPDTYKQTVKNIEHLRQEAQEQGKRITELHVYGEFKKLQLRQTGHL